MITDFSLQAYAASSSCPGAQKSLTANETSLLAVLGDSSGLVDIGSVTVEYKYRLSDKSRTVSALKTDNSAVMKGLPAFKTRTAPLNASYIKI